MSRPNLNTLSHKKCRYRVRFLSAAAGRVLVLVAVEVMLATVGLWIL